MKKEKSLVLVLSVCLLISIITNFVLAMILFNKGNHVKNGNSSSDSKIEVVTENEENRPVVESELNRKARDSFSITLYVNYDEEKYTFDKKYALFKHDYSCDFSVASDEHSYDKWGEYSLDTREELLDILCKYELSEYRPNTDESGQVVKGIIPYLVVINGNAKDTWVEVSNIDEFAEKMISLGDNLKN